MHQVSNFPHQGLVLVDHWLGGRAVFIEARRRHRLLEVADGLLALRDAGLEVFDLGLAPFQRAVAFARYHEEIARKAEKEGWTFGQYLHHLATLEVHERRSRRIARFLKDSDLPSEKTLATLTRARLPPKVAKMLPTLCEGGFVERGDNVLAFGLPGRGKSHLVCAVGHELIQRGYRVLFTPTYAIVQRLLAASSVSLLPSARTTSAVPLLLRNTSAGIRSPSTNKLRMRALAVAASSPGARSKCCSTLFQPWRWS